MVIKLRKVGNSVGLILPKNLIQKLHLAEGDTIEIIEETDGLKLLPQNPEFASWAESYRKVNTNFKNALQQLAK